MMRNRFNITNECHHRFFFHLLLHDDPGDGSLDHVGPVQAVHTVDSEDTFLLADDSSLIHPDTKKASKQETRQLSTTN